MATQQKKPVPVTQFQQQPATQFQQFNPASAPNVPLGINPTMPQNVTQQRAPTMNYQPGMQAQMQTSAQMQAQAQQQAHAMMNNMNYSKMMAQPATKQMYAPYPGAPQLNQGQPQGVNKIINGHV